MPIIQTRASIPITQTQSVRSCSRCGGDHEGVSFRPFVQPVAPPELDFAWTYWATCPTTGDPILLAIAE
jgi:hypothetical protein